MTKGSARRALVQHLSSPRSIECGLSCASAAARSTPAGRALRTCWGGKFSPSFLNTLLPQRSHQLRRACTPQAAHMVFARSLLICLLGLAAARKLPYHKGTEHFHQGAHRPACAQPLAARHSSSSSSRTLSRFGRLLGTRLLRARDVSVQAVQATAARQGQAWQPVRVRRGRVLRGGDAAHRNPQPQPQPLPQPSPAQPSVSGGRFHPQPAVW